MAARGGAKARQSIGLRLRDGRFLSVSGKKGLVYYWLDKHVTPKFVHERLLPTKSLNDVACQAPYDLIISVTVLDCIMEEEEFHQRLQDLRQWLVAGGKLFFLEWSAATERTPFSYRGLRTLETWRRALSDAGFVLNYVEPFFHPSEAVIPAWTKYRSCPPALGFRPLRRLGVPLGLCRWAMSQEARLLLRLWPYSPPAESPINILSGTKAITVR
jgi:hypothetical protein